MLRSPVTVPVSAVHGLLSGAYAQGLATPAWTAGVLEAAGIAPERLAQSGARVTAAQCVALFSVLVETLGDECLDQLSRPLRRGSLALVARSTLGAPSLAVAMRRAANSFSLRQDDVVLACAHEPVLSGITLVVPDASRASQNFLHELPLRVFWRLLVWLQGGRLVPRRFDFSVKQPAYGADYARIFPAPLRFGQSHSGVWFDAAALATRVRRDAVALQAFLHAKPGNLVGPHLVGPHLVEQATSARVRALLHRASSDWPDLVSTAARLHMSVSALQRHLAAEATSFQTFKDQLHRDLAIVRLNTSAVPRPRWQPTLFLPTAQRFSARSRPGPAMHRARTVPARHTMVQAP